jgi:hypothetical protein
MERLKLCDPTIESCDTLCTGGKCAWNACIDGDNDCLRQLAGAKCMVDPRWCAEAALRPGASKERRRRVERFKQVRPDALT